MPDELPDVVLSILCDWRCHDRGGRRPSDRCTRSPPQAAAQPPDTPVWSPQQLDNLIAPIALYPDPLLSQVLVASTYPLEIVEAQQWLQNNSSLTGADLIAAAEQQTWDASVQALVAFPDVLAKLNQDIRWTNDVGNAFLAQQADVMSAVQRMRASAKANGKLTSSPQQVVTTETANGQSSIEIQPASPDVVYVPTYDPGYVWGPPAWGAYPPLVYPAFGFGFGPAWNVGLCFAPWGGWGGCGRLGMGTQLVRRRHRRQQCLLPPLWFPVPPRLGQRIADQPVGPRPYAPPRRTLPQPSTLRTIRNSFPHERSRDD